MYRFRDGKKGFVESIRSVVRRDNYNEDRSENPYSRHALHSCRFIEIDIIKKCVYQQQKQIECRNLFRELKGTYGSL